MTKELFFATLLRKTVATKTQSDEVATGPLLNSGLFKSQARFNLIH
ncbi:hypothetical protein [Ferruginibacter profundus]